MGLAEEESRQVGKKFWWEDPWLRGETKLGRDSQTWGGGEGPRRGLETHLALQALTSRFFPWGLSFIFDSI